MKFSEHTHTRSSELNYKNNKRNIFILFINYLVIFSYNSHSKVRMCPKERAVEEFSFYIYIQEMFGFYFLYVCYSYDIQAA